MDTEARAAHIKTAKRIVIRRQHALGDVIMITPVIRRMREMAGERTIIDVATFHIDVFNSNPHVNKASASLRDEDYDLVINLDNAYERRREMHAVDAYMVETFGDANWPAKEMFLAKHPLPTDLDLTWHRSVVFHPAQTERSRTIRRSTWDSFARLLVDAGFTPVLIGKNRELSLSNKNGVIDTSGRLSLQQVARLIQMSYCFVSADTGMSHVAGTTETPIVTVFTSVRPEHRMPWRHGVLGWQVTPLVPQLPCIGCVHTGSCKNDFACTGGDKAVEANQLFTAVVRAVRRD